MPDKTLTEKKVRAYDLIRIIEASRRELAVLNQDIAREEQTRVVKSCEKDRSQPA
jgi:hypothetical protein